MTKGGCEFRRASPVSTDSSVPHLTPGTRHLTPGTLCPLTLPKQLHIKVSASLVSELTAIAPRAIAQPLSLETFPNVLHLPLSLETLPNVLHLPLSLEALLNVLHIPLRPVIEVIDKLCDVGTCDLLLT